MQSNSKSNNNNLNQSYLIVETFEINHETETILCEGYDEKISLNEDCGFEVEVTFKDFEEWMDDNEFLKGEGEDCTGPDHEGMPKYDTYNWDYTLAECLDGTAGWQLDQCLTQFINQTQKFKQLSK
jgi:hypothetical protein